jgi:hypothetical protein
VTIRRPLARLLAALFLYLSAGPVAAQLLLTGVGANSGTAPAFSVTYNNSYDTSSGGATTLTSSAITVGTAGSHRLIVVAVSTLMSSAGSISSLQIGGVSMNGVVTEGSTQTRTFGIYELVVTTGASVQITVNTTQNMTRLSLDVWTVQNANGDAHSNVSGANPNTGTSAVTLGSLTIPASGVAIAGARFSGNGVITWTGGGTRNSERANGASLEVSAYTDATAPGTSQSYVVTGLATALGRAGAASYGP